MKKLFSTLCLSALVSIAIVSCQKDESTTPLSNNSRSANGKATKVAICHKEGTAASKTLYVPEEAVAGHMGHGDSMGECGGPVTPQ
jgi:ABC-type enterochelin transport system substrate-binding protein